MICPNCQNENPESNHFCGRCGNRLSVAASNDDQAPAPAQDQAPASSGPSVRRPFIVSTTAMADVKSQTQNTRVVIPSPTLGATHSGYSSPLKPQPVFHGEGVSEPGPAPVDPEDEPIFAQDEVGEINVDSFADNAAEQDWLERTIAQPEPDLPFEETPNALREQRRAKAHEPAEGVGRNSFLYIDEGPEETHQPTVSGPSFLGLGADYMEEEPTTGHARRYLLLFLLAIVGVLGALEWRASRNGQSTNPMDVLHLKISKGKAEVLESKATPPANTTTSGASNTAANSKPELIAEPNQPATPKTEQPSEENLPPASPTASQPDAQPSASAEPAPSDSTAAQSQPAPTAAKSAEPPAQVAKAAPPPAPPAKPNAKASANKPNASKPGSSVPTPAATEADASLNAGNFELQKGVAAGPTELGRMWLWKAVAKGNGEAPVVLADMYAQGKGVPKDCEQAMLLLNAAAKKANPRARSKLGSMYAAGECVPQDRVKAYRWMSAALDANPGSDWIERNRETLLREMTPSERQRASR